MKKPSILSILSIALLATSCNGNNNAKKTVSVNMNAMVNANAKQYKVKAEYHIYLLCCLNAYNLFFLFFLFLLLLIPMLIITR